MKFNNTFFFTAVTELIRDTCNRNFIKSSWGVAHEKKNSENEMEKQAKISLNKCEFQIYFPWKNKYKLKSENHNSADHRIDSVTKYINYVFFQRISHFIHFFRSGWSLVLIFDFHLFFAANERKKKTSKRMEINWRCLSAYILVCRHVAHIDIVVQF